MNDPLGKRAALISAIQIQLTEVGEQAELLGRGPVQVLVRYMDSRDIT